MFRGSLGQSALRVHGAMRVRYWFSALARGERNVTLSTCLPNLVGGRCSSPRSALCEFIPPLFVATVCGNSCQNGKIGPDIVKWFLWVRPSLLVPGAVTSSSALLPPVQHAHGAVSVRCWFAHFGYLHKSRHYKSVSFVVWRLYLGVVIVGSAGFGAVRVPYWSTHLPGLVEGCSVTPSLALWESFSLQKSAAILVRSFRNRRHGVS